MSKAPRFLSSATLMLYFMGAGVSVVSAMDTVPISSCQDITTSGQYSLTSDLIGCTSAGQLGVGLRVSANNVDLDCGGHTISSAFGTQSIAVLVGLYVENVVIRNCNIAGHLSVEHSSNVQVIGNRATEIVVGGGRNDLVAHNQIDGGGGVGLGHLGSDDGILLLDASDYVIEDNIIKNVWDACIEGVNSLTNVTVTHNTMSNCGITGVSSYHGTSWTAVTITGNIVMDSPSFGWIAWQDNIALSSATAFVFEDNTIEGNVFRNPVNQGFFSVLNIDMRLGGVAARNNLLRKNSLGSTGIGPHPGTDWRIP